MKHVKFLTAVLLGTVLAITSCKDNDNKTDTTPNDADKSFLTNAAYTNRDEIDFAQLALTKSTNDSVRGFAQSMINDHTMARAELDSLANRFSYTLPTTIDSVHAALKPQLEALSGYSFDSAYIVGQLNDHTLAINLFQSELTQGNNQEIKNYATDKLPHLQAHYAAADSVRATLNSSP
jgi:putative membrane protein